MFEISTLDALATVVPVLAGFVLLAILDYRARKREGK